MNLFFAKISRYPENKLLMAILPLIKVFLNFVTRGKNSPTLLLLLTLVSYYREPGSQKCLKASRIRKN